VETIQEMMERLKKCNCKVTACPFCERKGIPANMIRENNKFKCGICGSEIVLKT